MPPIRLLIAEDHAIVRQGLRTIFSRAENITVVAEAENGEQAVALFRQHQPDVAMIDSATEGEKESFDWAIADVAAVLEQLQGRVNRRKVSTGIEIALIEKNDFSIDIIRIANSKNVEGSPKDPLLKKNAH